MTELSLFFLGISILLYVLLGGADFGAGIIEIFTGRKGVNIISKAIAPVWEANHIWLVVIIVVMFNAFPSAYSTITMYLHIPIMLALIGIIFRGTAFAFRYYDPYEDRSHSVYSLIFKIFSLFTPFFLGITLGAVISGKIITDPAMSFTSRFITPWLNLFSFSLGIFIVLLFAFLASVYLVGEVTDNENINIFIRYSKRLLFALILSGGFVFLTSEFDGVNLFGLFIHSAVSICCILLATLLLYVFFYVLKTEKYYFARIVAGAQTTFIIVGWFGAQFPVLVRFKNTTDMITIYNAVAPEKTLWMMILALLVGLSIVIPLLIYLFKVFKFSNEISD